VPLPRPVAAFPSRFATTESATIGSPADLETSVLVDIPIGEVWVHGPTVARGYLANPAATAESFVYSWFRTDDPASRGFGMGASSDDNGWPGRDYRVDIDRPPVKGV
jgi:non-ribosomal peptide synthetase component F